MPSLTRPVSIDAALQAGRQHSSVFIAGGTALQLQWIDVPQPANLVDLSGLLNWRTIAVTGASLRISAGATLEQCRTDASIARYAPLLKQACNAIGAYSVRNLGTLGGNIGWRLGDTLPALLASCAEVELGDGSRMPLALLLQQTPLTTTLPLITAVHMPCPTGTPAIFFEKVGHRAAFTPTVVAACGVLDVDASGLIKQAQLAISGAGLSACRLPELEEALAGCNVHDIAWRAGFESLLENKLGTLPGFQPYQQSVLLRLLPGRLYQLGEAV